MQSNHKKQMHMGNCQQPQQPVVWNANGLNVGLSSTMGQMMPNYNMINQRGIPVPQVQYSNMQQLQQQQPQGVVCAVPNNGMQQMQAMGMQSKSYNVAHPVNCSCRTAQLPTFPPQPTGIPLMPLGGAEMYPVNLNCMTPVGLNGQMCMFNSNYGPQSYIEPGLFVDPSQWNEICKQQKKVHDRPSTEGQSSGKK